MSTKPGPGTFCICGMRYELSGNFSRSKPKLFPLLRDSSTKDLIWYLVTGGLTVKVWVKSDLFP